MPLTRQGGGFKIHRILHYNREMSNCGYTSVRPFLYFDRSTSISLLRTFYFCSLTSTSVRPSYWSRSTCRSKQADSAEAKKGGRYILFRNLKYIFWGMFSAPNFRHGMFLSWYSKLKLKSSEQIPVEATGQGSSGQFYRNSFFQEQSHYNSGQFYSALLFYFLRTCII